jgi:hypothetical protein
MKTTKKNKRKCNYEKTTYTLDICHEKQLKEFENKYNNIQKLTKDKKNLEKKINTFKKEKNNETDIFIINQNNIENKHEKIFELEKKLKKINLEIDELNNKNNEIDYLSKTSDILFKYFDYVENENDDDDKKQNKKIVNFFSPYKNFDDNDKTIEHLGKSDFQNSLNREDLLENYLSKTDKDYINSNLKTLKEKCYHCNSENVNELTNDGILYCTDCNTIDYIIIDNERPSYKDPPKEISYFSYNRINHFNEWINQTQGKETTDIPEEVFDKIYLELKKNKINNMAILNYDKIKAILKKIKVNKYYEHIPYILNRITGRVNPQLTPELEEKLRNMFKEIQVPFLKHSPQNRKNFLSYSYVLHKFLEILGEYKYLPYFPLLKSREKLHQQEQTWKKICEELNWEFIRSI